MRSSAASSAAATRALPPRTSREADFMNTFGLHTFAIAPTWDLGRIERRIEELKEYGIGLLEVPLLRPEEIDTKASRAFASRWSVELVCSLGLPRALDVVDPPAR